MRFLLLQFKLFMMKLGLFEKVSFEGIALNAEEMTLITEESQASLVVDFQTGQKFTFEQKVAFLNFLKSSKNSVKILPEREYEASSGHIMQKLNFEDPSLSQKFPIFAMLIDLKKIPEIEENFSEFEILIKDLSDVNSLFAASPETELMKQVLINGFFKREIKKEFEQETFAELAKLMNESKFEIQIDLSDFNIEDQLMREKLIFIFKNSTNVALKNPATSNHLKFDQVLNFLHQINFDIQKRNYVIEDNKLYLPILQKQISQENEKIDSWLVEKISNILESGLSQDFPPLELADFEIETLGSSLNHCELCSI